MKLGSLRTGAPDGQLIVVDRGLERYAAVPDIVPTLQAALEHWPEVQGALETVYQGLNSDPGQGRPLSLAQLAAPLPRAYQWLDGSAYLSHVERVRKARGASMPPNCMTDPLMYQGHSAFCAGCRDPISVADETWGIDFEAEVVIITDHVPKGSDAQAAAGHIRLLLLANDVSLRNLIPAEIGKGFGFLHSKPGCAYSPVAVTPDELGAAWDGQRLRLPLISEWNGAGFGAPNAGVDMQFPFPALISHAARTRSLVAGTLIGSGTVSNIDRACGFSCIVEKRMQETLDHGAPQTPYMRIGDRVRIEMCDPSGQSIFGAIEQTVVGGGAADA